MHIVEGRQAGVDVRIVKEARQCAIHGGGDVASQEDNTWRGKQLEGE